MESLASASARFVAWVAVLRFVGVLVAVARQGLRRKQTVATRWGWVETLAAPEPFLMAACAYSVLVPGLPYDDVPATLALLGAVLAAAGILLWVAGFATIPSLSSGHYVLPEQQVITSGAFRLVRHPIYAAVFLLWFGLAAASASVIVLAVTIVYVVPVSSSTSGRKNG
jgi:protein-S-isoprenylcysteine O-methyltransferase Ste14